MNVRNNVNPVARKYAASAGGSRLEGKTSVRDLYNEVKTAHREFKNGRTSVHDDQLRLEK